MNEVKWGPGDEQTWPGYAGHANDPRADWDDEEETDEETTLIEPDYDLYGDDDYYDEYRYGGI